MKFIPSFLRRTHKEVEKADITLDETCKAKAFYNHRGPKGIKKYLARRLKTLKNEIASMTSRTKRAESTLAAMEKDRDKAHRAYDKANNDQNKKAAELVAAQNVTKFALKEKEDKQAKCDDQQAEIDKQNAEKSKREERLVEVENNDSLLKALEDTDMDKRPLGKDNNPEAKDYRKAVEHVIKNVDHLYIAEPTTVVRALVFLRLNGVRAAVGDIETPIQILRQTLGHLLYPKLASQREPSLSPDSKARAKMAEMDQEAKEAKVIFDRKRAAKRQREMDAVTVEDGAAKTPGGKIKKVKKAKSPEYLSAKERARREWPEEQFHAVFGTDEDLAEDSDESEDEAKSDDATNQAQDDDDHDDDDDDDDNDNDESDGGDMMEFEQDEHGEEA